MKPLLNTSLTTDLPDFSGPMNMYDQVFGDKSDDATALIDVRAERLDLRFGDMREMADRVAAGLVERGIASGDRVGVLFGQDPWCAAAHLGIWKIGAISVPLFKLFRRDALAVRIGDAAPKLVLTDSPDLVEGIAPSAHPKDFSVGAAPVVATDAETPALLIYTSGTTGKPKGALHGHRVLMGHLPGVEMSHDYLGQDGDVLWTPADWAWIGGLFDVLMPGLCLGVPVVLGRHGKFSADLFEETLTLSGARNLFLPPTALRILKSEGACAAAPRSVASGGEPLGAEMLAWGRAAFGITINEFYGQTECNMVASSCNAAFDPVPGAIGRAAPGFDVAVIDQQGAVCGGEGDIAVRRGAPSMMLEYWNAPNATAEKFRGDWLVTGDRGVLENGVLRFVGRDDDVITTAGYRVGPSEIEDCLMTHPDIATCGVVGKPDAVRTEIVKAYVVRKSDASVTEDELSDWVRTRLAAHSYPREITFVDSLPMTVSGKVIRKELRRLAQKEK